MHSTYFHLDLFPIVAMGWDGSSRPETLCFTKFRIPAYLGYCSMYTFMHQFCQNFWIHCDPGIHNQIGFT